MSRSNRGQFLRSRGVMAQVGSSKKQPNPERPCLVCGVPHRHNQPFCSAKCCEDHRAANKLWGVWTTKK